jgi:hypothetical protein
MLEALHRGTQTGLRKPLPGEAPPSRAKTKKGLTPLMMTAQEGKEMAMHFLLSVRYSHTRDALGLKLPANI